MDEGARLLTEEETAARLLISRRSLQRLCREKRIEFVQVTGRTRAFTEEQIADYIRRKTITPPKVVDSARRERVPFGPQVSRKGGESRGSTVRAHLREEMRQW